MPTVFSDIRGYRFFFFSVDRNEPMHIHVARQRGYAKFWLEPFELARTRNCRSHELNEIASLILENKAAIERKWREHFSKKS
ncbi:MAG: DUF4160 domain-containing protein [Candidatus Hydrogenedentes bacterium]|nr:DUF4160 domain-containing protein [Candidatus Hydrogenedentota bacterium]